MIGLEAQVAEWFNLFAYQPYLVYAMVIGLMFASSFGLPLPEEVTIVSASLTAFIASHPGEYPPPFEGAVGVQPITLAFVTLFAVFVSDYLIYWIGTQSSTILMKYPYFQKKMQGKPFQRVQKWIHEYGTLAPCIFRFTPGLRFPGHMMCGVIGLPRWKFCLVVGLAAMVTIPTQVLLISYYGRVILEILGQVKLYVLGAALIGGLIFIFLKWKNKKQSPPAES